jgi:hypothetical protein
MSVKLTACAAASAPLNVQMGIGVANTKRASGLICEMRLSVCHFAYLRSVEERSV